jgi:4-hydroxy-tetrahydrodipicolinate synthase
MALLGQDEAFVATAPLDSTNTGYGHRYDRCYSALVTPYVPGDPDKVDEDALRRLLRYHLSDEAIAAGIGIIINPEAGEVFYLTRDEQRRNVEIAVEEAGGRVPVFSGAAEPTTKGSALRAVDAIEAGADGLFLNATNGLH